MFSSLKLESWLTRVHSLVARWSLALVLTAFIITAVSAVYVARNLGINTDTADLLSEELPWRAAYRAYQQAFPQYHDSIVLVIDANTPDQTRDAAIAMAQRLKSEPQLFASVYEAQFSPFLRQNGLLYLEVEELEELADRLAEAQPFLSRLARDLTVHGFASVLTEATEELMDGGDIQVDRTFASVTETVRGILSGNRKPLSWQTLLTDRKVEPEDLRTIVIVNPKLDFNKLLPGETAVLRIREIVAEMNLNEAAGVRVRQTGGAALGYEELESVTRDAKKAGMLALGMVSIVLVVGLQSLWLVAASLITLIMGLVMTAAFATAAIGELNLISVAFAVLYIGLGVDFAIHYCYRFRELKASGGSGDALAETSRHIGGSLVLCALTTAIGFYAFIPTSYSGVAELGLIAGTGMFISLFTSLTLLPALLNLVPIKARPLMHSAAVKKLLAVPSQHPRKVCGVAIGLAIAASIALRFAVFDHNPIHLQDPSTESVQTFNDLLKDSTRSPLSITAIAKSGAQAQELEAQLSALEAVDATISIHDFIPAQQEEKLAIIEDMALVLGPEIEPQAEQPNHDTEVQIQSLEKLTHALERYRNAAEQSELSLETAGRLRTVLEDFLLLLRGASADERGSLLHALQSDLLDYLPGRLLGLSEALDAQAFAIEDLPDDLRARWISQAGEYRVEAFPNANLSDNEALEEFVEQVRSVAPEQVTGAPIINVEASAAVVSAFRQAFVSALIVIAILLFALLRQHRDVIIVLSPLLLAGLLTGAFTVVLNMPFNFANIIALPLLLGIGVDSALHILHRYRTALPDNKILLQTSTARAVVLSAMTTTCGFGNLSLSGHLGTASMGIMLTFGICFTLICTLVLLPSMLSVIPIDGRTAGAAR